MYNLFNKFLSDITPTYMCAGSINPINWLKQPKVFLQFNLSKYWWSYLELQFPALIIFQCQTLQPGMWTNLYALNNFLFYSVLFFLYSYIFCLPKPITPLCWCLVVLGYLPALHPTFTRLVTHIAIYLLLDEWYIYIYISPERWSNFVSGDISDERRFTEAPNNEFPHYQWAETWILHLSLSQSWLLDTSKCPFSRGHTPFRKRGKG